MAGKNVVIAGGYGPIFDGHAINILFGPQYTYIYIYVNMYIILYPKWKSHYVPIHQFIVNHYSIIHDLCNYIACSDLHKYSMTFPFITINYSHHCESP